MNIRICFTVILCILIFTNKITAFSVMHLQDSVKPTVSIKVDVDGKKLSRTFHSVPKWAPLKRGESYGWNQETIRKEFGKNAKKVGITIVDGKFKKRHTFDLGANIFIAAKIVSKYSRAADFTLNKSDYLRWIMSTNPADPEFKKDNYDSLSQEAKQSLQYQGTWKES